MVNILPIGFAIFTMLFGAGSVIFPLYLGREVGSMIVPALCGFILTGVFVPLLGLVSSAMFNGNYKKFFSMAGAVPGALFALVCMLLIGPFGAIPRCMTLAYASLQWHMPSVSLFIFSLLMSGLVFCAAIKRQQVVELFGKFVGPLKLVLLLTIVVLGLFSSSVPPTSSLVCIESFHRGFCEGYMTLDLLATIFFAGLVVAGIRQMSKKNGEAYSQREVVAISLRAGLIGGFLLGIVYAGFCLLAAKMSASIQGLGQDKLLSALATLILGPKANMLANMTMALACITTAIALTAVFADYISQELCTSRLSYMHALLITVALTFGMTNLGFSGVSHVIEPLAVVCYPALIVLSLANIAHVVWKFKHVQAVTLTALVTTSAVWIVRNFWL